jgi:hypothetical protein
MYASLPALAGALYVCMYVCGRKEGVVYFSPFYRKKRPRRTAVIVASDESYRR